MKVKVKQSYIINLDGRWCQRIAGEIVEIDETEFADNLHEMMEDNDHGASET